jgi:hypothetical protein
VAVNDELLPHETDLLGAGAYLWYADGKRVPVTETWRILRTRSGTLLETTADATAVADLAYQYTATLSLDAARRATALSMRVTKGGHRIAVSANLEADAAVVTRVVESVVEGALQRTQTFRMEPGYTIEAHPVLFDGLHIAAIDRTASAPYRRPVLWMDLSATEPAGIMAPRPTVYVIDRRPAGYWETYAITRWGNDPETAESLLSVKQHGPWMLPTEFRFAMAGVVYSAILANEAWEGEDDRGDPQ